MTTGGDDLPMIACLLAAPQDVGVVRPHLPRDACLDVAARLLAIATP